jgi:glycosyltransferase involved in cell wall biosynthesis
MQKSAWTRHRLIDSGRKKFMTADISESSSASGAGAKDAGPCVFSIIIPAFNEEKMIGRCLDSIARLDYPKDAFEVIVVDNGSTDQTVEIARSFGGRLAISVLVRPRVYISALRNAGASAAKGRIFAFLDADMLVPPDWLRQAETIFAQANAGVTGGHCSAPADSSWVARSWFGRRHRTTRWQPSYVPSGNLLVSRRNFFKIGGFDDQLQTSEDCDFSSRAKGLGMTLEGFESISVVHLGCPETVRDFFRREIWHGTSATRVFFRNIVRFQNGKAVLFAIYMLACLVGIILGSGHAIVYHKYDVLSVSVSLALLAPLFLGSMAMRVEPNWADFIRLSALYLLYGVARALSLLRATAGISLARNGR